MPALCALAAWRGRRQLSDRQRFLEGLYALLLENRLDAAGHGALDVKLEADVKTAAEYYQEAVPQALGSGVALAGSMALLLWADWRIGLIFALLNLAQFLPSLVYERWAKRIYRETRGGEEAYYGWLLEGSRGIRTLKAYGQEEAFLDRYRLLSRRIARMGKRAEQTAAVENILYEAVNTLLGYGSYLLLGLFVLWGWLAVPQTPFFLVLAACLFSSMEGLFTLQLKRYDLRQAAERLAPLPRREGAPEPPEGSALLRARDIRKRYGEREALGALLARRGRGTVLISHRDLWPAGERPITLAAFDGLCPGRSEPSSNS